jgi:hypothetical protein
VKAEPALGRRRLGDRPITAVDEREATWPAVAVAVPRTYARAGLAALAGLVVLSAVARALIARQIETPWIMVDELIYSELAKSFAERGELLVRDLPSSSYGFVYPIAVAPAWLADSMGVTYGIAKTINAFLMSLVAVPTYFWARRLVSPLLSLVAAALVLCLPVFVYTGNIMTENAFLPAFALAAFATALALERPTIVMQALALAAAALATGVRVQGVVLFGVIVLSVGLKVLLDVRVRAGRPWPLTRPYMPMLLAIAVGALGYGALKLAQGESLSSGLGAYAVVTGADYSVEDGARWVSYHFAELSLALGVVPLAALVVVAALAVARGLPGPAERAFVAVATSAVVLLVVQVGLFASRFAYRVEERNMIAVAPVLLLALVLWIGRGLPRPPVISAVAALGSAALLLYLPLPSLLNLSALSDTFGLIPVLRLSRLVFGGVDESRWIIVLGGLNAALAFLLLPRRVAAIGLPVLLAGYFALATNLVLREVTAYSDRLRSELIPQPTWIDDRVGENANVAYLSGSNADPFGETARLYQLEFWNRSLRGVYSVGGTEADGITELPVQVGRGGSVPVDSPQFGRAQFVVADQNVAIAERKIAQDSGLSLYAIRPPLRIESVVRGAYPDGVFGSTVSYDRYATPGGRPGLFLVHLSRETWKGPDKPGHVVATIGPLGTAADGTPQITRVTARQTWTIHSGPRRTLLLPTPRPPFGVRIDVTPTFSPADYGAADARQIGAWVGFEFRPVD